MSLSVLVLRIFTLTVLSTFIALIAADSPSHDLYYSKWYDWGLHGVHPRQFYKSFSLAAPQLNFLQWSDRCDQGYTFMSPRGGMVPRPGPVIMDARGELVWMEDKFGQAMDFKMQHYKGQDYLTFWTGSDSGTFGSGVYNMLDSSYEVYKIVTPANGLVGDLHEFKITEQGTAMMTSYEAVQTDLSTFGIIGEGWIYDSVFQEIDLETGKLIFEWHASDHYSVEESYHNPGEAGKTSDNAWDFFHINSISKTDEGNYIISSRYMFTVTCISPKGDILWILGGKRNYFTDLSEGAASNFSWQHDARWLGSVGNVHTITVFDNGKFDRWSPNADYSRGLMISLDVENWTAEVLHTYIEPHHALAPSQGSVQMLPETNNNVFVGWGYYSAYTEFSLEAEVLCNVHIAPEIFFNLGWVKSYRAFRTSLWHGYPKTQPSVSLKSSDKTLYVSWNGATDVSSWILQGSDSDSDSDLHFSHSDTFTNLSTTPKTKFETQITVTKETPQYIRIAALDASGKILGYSEPMDRTKGNIPFWDGFVGTLFLVLGMIIGVAVPYYIYLRRRRSKILFSSSTAKYTILGSHGHSGKAKWLMILDSLPFRKRDPESRSRRRRRRSRRTSGDKSSPAVMEIMGFDSLSSQHHSEYDDDGIGKGEERQGNDHHELRRFID